MSWGFLVGSYWIHNTDGNTVWEIRPIEEAWEAPRQDDDVGIKLVCHDGSNNKNRIAIGFIRPYPTAWMTENAKWKRIPDEDIELVLLGMV